MEPHAVTEGMEVVHSTFGRGNVAETHPSEDDEMPVVSVYFYRTGELRDVPVYSVSAATAVTSIDSREGTRENPIEC